jgi:hypothetical protein
MRLVAYKLEQYGKTAQALNIFERVLRIRSEEPQSYRDLALANSRLGNHQRAIELLRSIIERSWHSRFPQIQVIALQDLSYVQRSQSNADANALNRALIPDFNLDAIRPQVRIVVTWISNDCDVSLLVTEPNGTVCSFLRNRTATAMLSEEFTAGYGPVQYVNRGCASGIYKISLKLHNSKYFLPHGTFVRVTIQADFDGLIDERIAVFNCTPQLAEVATIRI